MQTQEKYVNLTALREVSLRSPDLVLIADTVRDLIVFANAAATRLLAVTEGEDLRRLKSLIDSVEREDQEYVKNKFGQLTENKILSDVEFRLKLSTKKIWLSCDIMCVDDSLLYVVGRDITRAKEHENYLVEFAARKDMLLETLIHQLSGSLTLMNNLALRADKLKAKSDLEGVLSLVSLIHSNSVHCIKIIDDLMIKEHSESPGIYVKFSRVDIVHQVTYIFEELQKNDGSRKFVLETTSPALFIDTDDMKILQVVNNLVSNALKFTREGDEIRVSLKETESTIVISVSDTGIGIPKNLQPFLFEKHGPARRTGLNGEKSIGLGLSICYNLTNLVGGRIWFESEEGKGTTFYIALPKD